MKKVILTIAVVFFGLTTLFANNSIGGPLKTKKALAKQISRTIEYPEFAKEEQINCAVFVKLRQEADGKVTVIGCDSQVGSMREYVREELSKMNFKSDELEIGREYIIKVEFIFIE
jgi:hypothetical protein